MKASPTAWRATVYRRSAVADGQGTFTWPPLRFAAEPRLLAYRVIAVVQEARGDHARAETASPS